MITAVDTNVLVDVFVADEQFGEQSREALRVCRREGSLIACDVVWAEVAGVFHSSNEAADALTSLRVEFSPLRIEACLAAGTAWRDFRAAGRSRRRVVADFLIGAHGALAADRLLSRDRGFYRMPFDSLTVVDPSTP